ncbi:hypothetical protein Ahy_A02g006752 isoform D [Arachis hypogaea]|uniref:Uncharacterized protein n=1 Tax=Arachis hypogaea TaxID=3818 RepID=A0A445EAH1_ARAHY|nr:hypothetical protein Ahy_A02g006752 isoform D [Arachis hypogaea]
MAGEDSFIVLVHHRGSIKRKTRSGVKFTDKDPLCIIDSVKYDSFTIGNDEDLQVMFLYRRQFPEVRTPELLAKLVDATVAGSSSRSAVASSSVPAYEPPAPPVASPSFAVDLNGSVGDEVGTAKLVPTSVHCATPAGAGDGLFDDVEDDDVEPDMITDDSGDEIGASEPAGAGGGSSSGTQQYLSHFLSLDLDAMRQPGVPGEAAGFGARDAEGSVGMTEFQLVSNFRIRMMPC